MLDDVWQSGVFPTDRGAFRAELLAKHRVAERCFLLDYIQAGSVGAELGVFTGLFSSVLARQAKVRQVTFVDPWWLAFGETYPSWGAYTAHGALSTRVAHQLATRRVARPGLPGRIIEPAFSYDWLQAQPDYSLDWVYLDSTHTYEGTKAELELLDAKIKPDGVILGDDWQQNRAARHHGVCLAVNEFVKACDFEFALSGVATQWVLRRPAQDRSAMPMIVKDPLWSAQAAIS
jgi:hypothetical protein